MVIAVTAGLAFGLWMVIADTAVFAAIIPHSQRVLFEQTPLALQLPVIAGLVIYDEVLLRLLALPLLVAALSAVTKQRTSVAWWAAILITAAVLWPLLTLRYLTVLDWSALTVLREISLHVAAGTLWGWLCWRHGWLSGLTGHLSAYLALVPLLSP